MSWEIVDQALNWRGEWDANTNYDQFDAVLYKTEGASEWHTFVSKVSHNVGNQPTISPAFWRRRYQEQFI